MNKTLRLNKLKTSRAVDAKISEFVICVEAIIYLLLYILHYSTFKLTKTYNNNLRQNNSEKKSRVSFKNCANLLSY